MDFRNLSDFSTYLNNVATRISAAEHSGLEAGAKIIQTEAQAEIGHYQDAAGPFAAWAPLAQSTLEGWGGHPGKIAMGYAPPDNPLLRTGEMRASIETKVVDGVAYIGSNSEIALWQELGTNRIPPRSFLGGAAVRKGHEAAVAVGLQVYKTVLGTLGHE